MRFAAQVVHLGRAFGVVRVTAHNDDSGKLFAIATVTLSPVNGASMKVLDTAYETLDLGAPAPGVVVVTLNRPGRYNAMTATMFDGLERAAIALDDEDDLRAVIITGAGKAFARVRPRRRGGTAAAQPAGHARPAGCAPSGALLAVRSARVPVIAAVNGPAPGGGLSLALAADIRLASAAAKFNAAFVRIGLSAGDLGASWLLTRLIGPGAASEICFTGRIVAAAEAFALGLVNALSEPETLLDDALALAASIAANSPGGVQLSKRALQANMETASYAAAIELENRGQALLTRGEDFPEALAAFKDKRPPVFTGR